MSGSLVVFPVTLLKCSVRNRCSFYCRLVWSPRLISAVMEVYTLSMVELGLWSQMMSKIEAAGALRSRPEAWSCSSVSRVLTQPACSSRLHPHQRISKLGHASHPTILEAEAGGSEVQSHPLLPRELQTSLVY